MSSRKILLAGASLLAITTALTQTAQAQCATSGTISSSCPGPIALTGDLHVDAAATVSLTSADTLITNSGSIALLGNLGTLHGWQGQTAIRNEAAGTINLLQLNAGAADAGQITIGGAMGGIAIQNLGHIVTLSTDGTVAAELTGGGSFLENASLIDLITIASDHINVAGTFARGIYNDTTGTITTLSIASGSELSIQGTFAGGGVLNLNRIGAIDNAGTIRGIGSSAGVGISNTGTLGSLTNSGLIQASGGYATGVLNTYTIGTLTNSGVIAAYSSGTFASGLYNSGTITLLSNTSSGTITASSTLADIYGIMNFMGSIGTLLNAGVIETSGTAPAAQLIANTGAIGSLTNSGTISAHASGLATAIANGGSLGTITNSGLLDVTSNTGVANGILNQGVIQAISNSGSINAVSGVTTMPVGFFAAGINNNGTGTIGLLTNTGTITAGSTIVGSPGAAGLLVVGNIGEINNSGYIEGKSYNHDGFGVFAGANVIQTVTNTGTIRGNGDQAYGLAFYGSTIGLVDLSSASSRLIADAYSGGAALLNDGGTVTSIVNGGQISGQSAAKFGIANNGIIAALTNSGDIHALNAGIQNDFPGTIAVISNSGTIEGHYPSSTATVPALGISNIGEVGTLTNSGQIMGIGSIQSAGIQNAGSITLILNEVSGSVYANSTFATGLVNYEWIGVIENAGQIYGTSARSAVGVFNTGIIGTLSNTGFIGAEASDTAIGLSNVGTLGVLSNSGEIDASAGNTVVGIRNTGFIGSFSNAGEINASETSMSADVTGLLNFGTIAILSNTGTIAVSSDWEIARGIYNWGSIGSLDNGGLISVAATSNGAVGVLNRNGQTITALSNTGVISVQGGSSGPAVGLQNQGMLGTLTNSGTISISGYVPSGLLNMATVTAFDNSGLMQIRATGSDNAYAIVNDGTLGSVMNSGTIVVDGDSAMAYGVRNEHSIGAFTNSGRITVTSDDKDAYGLFSVPLSTLTSIDNSGTITVSGHSYATGINNGGSIGSLSNSGLISASQANTTTGNVYGIYNNNAIGTLTNSGTITARGPDATAVENTSSITEFTNTPTGVISGIATIANGTGVHNWGSIGTFSNSGTITASLAGSPTDLGHAVRNSGTIGVLTNSGYIGGPSHNTDALINEALGSIGRLENSGTIFSDSQIALVNEGGIGTILNSGTIAVDSSVAFVNAATVGTFLNSGWITVTGSGLLVGIGSTGTITFVSNTGTIALNPTAPAGAIAISGSGDFGTIMNSGMMSVTADAAAGIGGVGFDVVENSGTITVHGTGAATGIGAVSITGHLSNSGLISASAATYTAVGVVVTDAGTISNTGTIEAVATGTGIGMAAAIQTNRTVTLLSNSGLVSGTAVGLPEAVYGLYNFATISQLANSGTIRAIGPNGVGIYNGTSATSSSVTIVGSIGTLTNSGLITGSSYAIRNQGVLGPIVNSGTISGNIDSAMALTISGSTVSSAPGTLTGGTISAPSITFDGGHQLLADNITATSVTNTGASVKLTSVVTITGDYAQSAPGSSLIFSGAGELDVTGAANLTGGTVTAALAGTGNYMHGEAGPTLISATGGLNYSGVSFDTSLIGVEATASVVGGTDLVVTYQNDYVGGTLANLTITDSVGLYIGPTGTIDALVNDGTINGTEVAIYNGGTIGSLTNNGTIMTGGGTYGIANFGVIGTLTNSGTITGSDHDIYNQGSIGTFINTGHIGSPIGFEILAGGTVDNLINSGLIQGTTWAIHNAGVLGTITNTGTIDGDIFSANAFTVIGGSGAVYGTLAGGTITAPGMTFASGNQIVEDDFNVGSGTVTNAGGVVQLNGPQTITGNFAQTGGTIDFGASGQLVVSGTATMSGGTVQTGGYSATSIYLVTDPGRTVVDAATGSSYSGLAANSGLTGLDLRLSTDSTEDLVVTNRSDYIGASLASLTTTGVVGNNYGVYIATTGDLSALSNGGTITGSTYAIYNAGVLGPIANARSINGNIYSVTPLTISGGTGTNTGLLTGGTITAPSVTFTTGTITLRDRIVAGGGTGTVTNSGATIALNAARTITGNYAQTAGGLNIDVTSASAYGSLLVSGNATVTNSLITLGGTGLSYGQTLTIVDATGTGTYSGNTVDAGSFIALLQVVNNDLLVMLGLPFEDIGTAAGGDAAVMGSVLQDLQGVSGFLPFVSALGGAPNAEIVAALQQTAPAQVSGGAALLQRAMLVSEQIDSAIGQRTRHKGNGHGWSLWGQGMGGAASRGAEAAVQPYRITSWGMALGADTKASDNLVLGGAVSWNTGWNHGKGMLSGNINRVTSWQLTGYGSWDHGNLFVNGLFGAGFDSYDQHRRIDALDQTATADYNGRHYELALDGGYVMNHGDFSLTPTASVKWLSLDVDGFAEAGGGALNLSVGEFGTSQIESGLGAILSWNAKTSFGELVPDLKLMWLHDFQDGAVLTHSRLSGVDLATSAARPGSDALSVGGGISLFGGENVSVRLSYDGDFRSGYTGHSGALQVRIQY